MIKKSSAKKISGKAKKKDVKKKIAPVPASPPKPAARKKADRKSAPKVTLKKLTVQKQKDTAQTRKKEIKKAVKTRVKQKPEAEKAIPKGTLTKPPAKPHIKTSKKTEISKKEVKSRRTATVKAITKRGKEKKSLEIKTTGKNISEKPQKKVSAGITEKPLITMKRKTPSQKPGTVATKKKEPAKKEIPRKIERAKKTTTVRPSTKRPPLKDTEGELIKKAEDVIPAREVEIVVEPTEMPEDISSMEKPRGDILLHFEPLETLPSEYGENEITLMPINPYKLFAFWEVRKETLAIFKGVLNLRIYDVTGIDFDTTDAHSFYDITVHERIGKRYLQVSPAKEYIADIGILYNGIYIGIARSDRISTPVADVPGKEDFLTSILESGTRVGY